MNASLKAEKSRFKNQLHGGVTFDDAVSGKDADLELRTIRFIVLREECLGRLRDALRPAESREELTHEIFILTQALRHLTVQVCTSIRKWRAAFIDPRPFMWSEINYLLYLPYSMGFLELFSPLVQWFGFHLNRNPFLVPAGGVPLDLLRDDVVAHIEATDMVSIRESEELILEEERRVGALADRDTLCGWCSVGVAYKLRRQCRKCRRWYCRKCIVVNVGTKLAKLQFNSSTFECFWCDYQRQRAALMKEVEAEDRAQQYEATKKADTMRRMQLARVRSEQPVVDAILRPDPPPVDLHKKVTAAKLKRKAKRKKRPDPNATADPAPAPAMRATWDAMDARDPSDDRSDPFSRSRATTPVVTSRLADRGAPVIDELDPDGWAPRLGSTHASRPSTAADDPGAQTQPLPPMLRTAGLQRSASGQSNKLQLSPLSAPRPSTAEGLPSTLVLPRQPSPRSLELLSSVKAPMPRNLARRLKQAALNFHKPRSVWWAYGQDDRVVKSGDVAGTAATGTAATGAEAAETADSEEKGEADDQGGASGNVSWRKPSESMRTPRTFRDSLRTGRSFTNPSVREMMLPDAPESDSESSEEEPEYWEEEAMRMGGALPVGALEGEEPRFSVRFGQRFRDGLFLLVTIAYRDLSVEADEALRDMRTRVPTPNPITGTQADTPAHVSSAASTPMSSRPTTPGGYCARPPVHPVGIPRLSNMPGAGPARRSRTASSLASPTSTTRSLNTSRQRRSTRFGPASPPAGSPIRFDESATTVRADDRQDVADVREEVQALMLRTNNMLGENRTRPVTLPPLAIMAAHRQSAAATSVRTASPTRSASAVPSSRLQVETAGTPTYSPMQTQTPATAASPIEHNDGTHQGSTATNAETPAHIHGLHAARPPANYFIPYGDPPDLPDCTCKGCITGSRCLLKQQRKQQLRDLRAQWLHGMRRDRAKRAKERLMTREPWWKRPRGVWSVRALHPASGAEWFFEGEGPLLPSSAGYLGEHRLGWQGDVLDTLWGPEAFGRRLLHPVHNPLGALGMRSVCDVPQLARFAVLPRYREIEAVMGVHDADDAGEEPSSNDAAVTKPGSRAGMGSGGRPKPAGQSASAGFSSADEGGSVASSRTAASRAARPSNSRGGEADGGGGGTRPRVSFRNFMRQSVQHVKRRLQLVPVPYTMLPNDMFPPHLIKSMTETERRELLECGRTVWASSSAPQSDTEGTRKDTGSASGRTTERESCNTSRSEESLRIPLTDEYMPRHKTSTESSRAREPSASFNHSGDADAPKQFVPRVEDNSSVARGVDPRSQLSSARPVHPQPPDPQPTPQVLNIFDHVSNIVSTAYTATVPPSSPDEPPRTYALVCAFTQKEMLLARRRIIWSMLDDVVWPATKSLIEARELARHNACVFLCRWLWDRVVCARARAVLEELRLQQRLRRMAHLKRLGLWLDEERVPDSQSLYCLYLTEEQARRVASLKGSLQYNNTGVLREGEVVSVVLPAAVRRIVKRQLLRRGTCSQYSDGGPESDSEESLDEGGSEDYAGSQSELEIRIRHKLPDAERVVVAEWTDSQREQFHVDDVLEYIREEEEDDKRREQHELEVARQAEAQAQAQAQPEPKQHTGRSTSRRRGRRAAGSGAGTNRSLGSHQSGRLRSHRSDNSLHSHVDGVEVRFDAAGHPLPLRDTAWSDSSEGEA